MNHFNSNIGLIGNSAISAISAVSASSTKGAVKQAARATAMGLFA